MFVTKQERHMTTIARSHVRLLLVDAALLTTACLVPAVSHLLAFPVYMLNPMLALLLVALLVGRDWRNALVMAILMPAVSCLITGMPVVAKMVCMMAELATVAAVFTFAGRKLAILPAILTAIFAGKIVYYALKAIIIAPAVLIGTTWTIQLFAVLLWGGLFALLYKKSR